MFRRIFLTYLSILILVMAVLTLVTSSLAENYVYEEKKQLLENVANRANNAASAFASGEISQAELNEIINAMGYITDTKIYIVTSDIMNGTLGGELTGEYLKDALDKAFSGKSVFLRRQYSEGFEAQMLFMAIPWNSGKTTGAILLFSPEKEIASIIKNIQLAIWLIAAAFVVIGGIIIFAFSRRIVRPIKAIGSASAKMALGERVDDIDITSKDELAGMARSFNSMKRKIELNEKLRQDLIANISHDLRTPVTNISGFLSGMADGIIKIEDYPKYIGILKKETKRLADLTGGILEAAKIQSGSIELIKSKFALRGAAEKAIEANREAARSKDVSISMDIDPGLIVNADERKIEQSLFNLINNAVKFSFSGGAVNVSAVCKEDGVEVCVEDRGKGIDKQDLPNIFERFYKAGEGGGFGLGLNIVKSYIEAHGGRLAIESEPGKGTAVRFVLNP